MHVIKLPFTQEETKPCVRSDDNCIQQNDFVEKYEGIWPSGECQGDTMVL